MSKRGGGRWGWLWGLCFVVWYSRNSGWRHGVGVVHCLSHHFGIVEVVVRVNHLTARVDRVVQGGKVVQPAVFTGQAEAGFSPIHPWGAHPVHSGRGGG